MPPPYDKTTAYAVKAMADGKASDGQQKLALRYILLACGKDDLEFRPESDRASAFAGGKRFVGLQITKLIDMPPSILEQMD